MVAFDNFHRLDPSAREIALEMLNAADQRREPFFAFPYRWMAFNGWMSAITLEYNDRDMIDALVACQRLQEAHDRLVINSNSYAHNVAKFSDLWPILNVKDVRKKLGYDAFWKFDRTELIKQCDVKNVKQQPQNWTSGQDPTWEQTLRSIYQVRCNLFHGEKSPQKPRDVQLVELADNVLKSIILLTDCFNWQDS